MLIFLSANDTANASTGQYFKLIIMATPLFTQQLDVGKLVVLAYYCTITMLQYLCEIKMGRPPSI